MKQFVVVAAVLLFTLVSSAQAASVIQFSGGVEFYDNHYRNSGNLILRFDVDYDAGAPFTGIEILWFDKVRQLVTAVWRLNPSFFAGDGTQKCGLWTAAEVVVPDGGTDVVRCGIVGSFGADTDPGTGYRLPEANGPYSIHLRNSNDTVSQYTAVSFADDSILGTPLDIAYSLSTVPASSVVRLGLLEQTSGAFTVYDLATTTSLGTHDVDVTTALACVSEVSSSCSPASGNYTLSLWYYSTATPSTAVVPDNSQLYTRINVKLDLVTQAPTLSGITNNSVVGGDFSVQILLPEAALAVSSGVEVRLQGVFSYTLRIVSACRQVGILTTVAINTEAPITGACISDPVSSPEIVDGTYQIYVAYRDAAGNVEARSAYYLITITTTAKHPTITAPVDGAHYGESIPFAYTVHKPLNSLKISLTPYGLDADQYTAVVLTVASSFYTPAEAAKTLEIQTQFLSASNGISAVTPSVAALTAPAYTVTFISVLTVSLEEVETVVGQIVVDYTTLAPALLSPLPASNGYSWYSGKVPVTFRLPEPAEEDTVLVHVTQLGTDVFTTSWRVTTLLADTADQLYHFEIDLSTKTASGLTRTVADATKVYKEPTTLLVQIQYEDQYGNAAATAGVSGVSYFGYYYAGPSPPSADSRYGIHGKHLDFWVRVILYAGLLIAVACIPALYDFYAPSKENGTTKEQYDIIVQSVRSVCGLLFATAFAYGNVSAETGFTDTEFQAVAICVGVGYAFAILALLTSNVGFEMSTLITVVAHAVLSVFGMLGKDADVKAFGGTGLAFMAIHTYLSVFFSDLKTTITSSGLVAWIALFFVIGSGYD